MNTLTAWNDLVEYIRGLDLFAQVERLPLNLVRDEKFVDAFPSLKFPACLVIYLGESEDGDRRHRTTRYSAIIACKHAKGQAAEEAVALKDTFKETFLGRDVGDQWIRPKNQVAVAMTDIEYAVIEISFQVEERE